MKSFLLAYYFSAYSTLAFLRVVLMFPDQYFYVQDGIDDGFGVVYHPDTGYIQSIPGGMRSIPDERHRIPIAFGLRPEDIQTPVGIQSGLSSSDRVSNFGSDVTPQFISARPSLAVSKSKEISAAIQTILKKIRKSLEDEKEIERDLSMLMITVKDS